MPIPLLFLGIGALSGAIGVGSGIKAAVDNSTAKSINESANYKLEKISKEMDEHRKNCWDVLDNLGREKVFILNSSVKSFLEAFGKLKEVEFVNSQGLEELSKYKVDVEDLRELKKMGSVAADMGKGAVAGVAGGAFVAYGAYSAAMSFASASTGTAIATLSGAAATNATLAFFGGGSIAAGGLGMSVGSAVLGGLVAGPALLVMGIITGSKASKNLDDAKINAAEIDKHCEQLKNGIVQCKAIWKRTFLFYNLLARLDAILLPLVCELENIIEKEGTDYSKFSDESKQTVASAASVAGTIKAVLDTPILSEDGSVTAESEKLSVDILEALN